MGWTVGVMGLWGYGVRGRVRGRVWGRVRRRGSRPVVRREVHEHLVRDRVRVRGRGRVRVGARARVRGARAPLRPPSSPG